LKVSPDIQVARKVGKETEERRGDVARIGEVK
jgi:hypothetical protein